MAVSPLTGSSCDSRFAKLVTSPISELFGELLSADRHIRTFTSGSLTEESWQSTAASSAIGESWSGEVPLTGDILIPPMPGYVRGIPPGRMVLHPLSGGTLDPFVVRAEKCS